MSIYFFSIQINRRNSWEDRIRFRSASFINHSLIFSNEKSFEAKLMCIPHSFICFIFNLSSWSSLAFRPSFCHFSTALELRKIDRLNRRKRKSFLPSTRLPARLNIPFRLFAIIYFWKLCLRCRNREQTPIFMIIWLCITFIIDCYWKNSKRFSKLNIFHLFIIYSEESANKDYKKSNLIEKEKRNSKNHQLM